ncbi:hypothetical protein BpJC7_26280 [Weizmannia acidilactici]|uniref:Uncharacterized protein n=1 Tax=Weizmannia acidilactici TaxID=2607726 RepID=A0A5J4JKV7_9BACI|nr:hypothetical protein [Weizmannia acidilactici]GER71325.1 hypothetical protein BpJC7_26280 [Weizmannia acidilactici]
MGVMQEKFNEMMSAYQQTLDLPNSVTTIARELKKIVNEEIQKINSDPLYSDEGKAVERQKIRDHFGQQFIKTAKKLRDDYEKAVVKAKTNAEILLNEEPPKPDDITLKTFQRELNALKMDVLLSTDPEKAVQAISEFASKQTNPYLAKQLAGEFAGLASNIIASSGQNPSVKLKLRDTLDTINSRAMTPEQQKAQEIAGYMKDAWGRDLFRSQSIELNTIEQAVGQKYAQYANKPHLFPVSEE